ncbi:GNAT family N-acetyltransferase [Paenibacillus lautus]|uniref:GNAT family N-acetyltransferase n=1 Tax=Paenibacillus lautus TaxID=1401 RepID=UPI003D2E0903
MNPILIDFPSQFFTDRLLIRSPYPGDGKIVYESIMASLNELRRWLPFAQKEQSEEIIEANLREAYLKFLKREDLRFLIFHKDSNQYIGSSGLHNPNWNIPKFEIGYWIDSRQSGQGFMTEAVQGISDFAFNVLKARRVEIRCDTLNDKSRSIPERLGFTLEGTLRNEDTSVDGSTLRDTFIFAKIDEKNCKSFDEGFDII